MFAALLIVCSLPVVVIMNGFVLSVLWDWFMVPLGIPDVGVAHALGLGALVALLTHQDMSSLAKEKGRYSGEAIATAAGILSRPLVTLLVCYILTMFM